MVEGEINTLYQYQGCQTHFHSGPHHRSGWCQWLALAGTLAGAEKCWSCLSCYTQVLTTWRVVETNSGTLCVACMAALLTCNVCDEAADKMQQYSWKKNYFLSLRSWYQWDELAHHRKMPELKYNMKHFQMLQVRKEKRRMCFLVVIILWLFLLVGYEKSILQQRTNHNSVI